MSLPTSMGARLIAALLLLATFVAGCAIAPTAAGSPFQAAAIAPADAWSFSSVTLRPGPAQAILLQRLINAFTSQPGFDTAWASARTTKIDGRQVDLEKDVLPLLDGEIALALRGTSQPIDAILFYHSSAPDKLGALLVEGAPPPVKGSKGELVWTASSGQAVAYKGWFVTASPATPAAQLVDLIDGKGGPSLATTDFYRKATSGLPGDRVGYGVIDLQAVAPALVEAAAGTVDPSALDPSALAGARVAYAVVATPDGLDVRVDVASDNPKPPEPTDHEDLMLVADHLPAQSLVALAGTALHVSDAQVQALQGRVDDERASALLDLLGAASGEFATGAWVSDPTPTAPNFGFRARWTNKLNADASGDDVLDAVTRLVGGDPFDPVGTFGADVVGGWLLAEVPAPAGEDTAPLSANPRYAALRAVFQDADSLAFVDAEGVRSAYEARLSAAERAAYERSTKPWLTPVRAFGASWHTDPAGQAHARLFITIKP